jgi:nucleotide-binding universal stress UspA family protein
MTILVPTDFSKLSKVAVLYAARIAKKLKANVILLAVIGMNTSAASSIKWRKLEDEMIKMAEQDAVELLEEVRSEVKGELEIQYRYISGHPVEEMIEKFVVDNEVDLIVMGTKGATGLKKVVLGTNATAVIDNSSRPVIVVPGETEFMEIKKIVYASDMANISEEIETLVMFARIFDASIQILHVIPSNSETKVSIQKTVADLVKQTNYSKISLEISSNDRVADAVDLFVADQKADMLAMFTHKLDFYEKLFGKSVTQQLAFHVTVPLLTFNKTTLV